MIWFHLGTFTGQGEDFYEKSAAKVCGFRKKQYLCSVKNEMSD